MTGALLVAACGDDGGTPAVDARPIDGAIDGATIDAPMIDADIDAPMVDAGVDAPMIDAAVDAPPMIDANTGLTSMQIMTVRATADGTGLDLPIAGAIVTYLKPQIGSTTNDPAGFFIQAEQPGPALFVAVDPATLTPAAAVGDVVSFSVNGITTLGGLRAVNAITGFARTASGVAIDPLAQNLTAATDVVTALDSYESEIVDLTANVGGAFAFAGTGFEAANINSTGITGDNNFKLRIPATIRDALDLVTGCDVTVNNVPVWRFNTQAQINPSTAAGVTLANCPAPNVVSAVALSSTSVQLTFSRRVLASSVVAAGTQFTFDNGLTATAASVTDRTVTLTTSAQTGGTTYTVTVANTVTDLQGTALGTPNTSTFTGFQMPAQVRINEVNANIAGGCDLIELRVVAGGVMTGFVLQERDTATLLTFPSFTVATNDLIVVHMNGGNATCNPGASGNETTAANQNPQATFAANYDTAFDFYSTDTGLTNTDNVFTLYDNTGAIIDAILVANLATGTAAAGSETQAAAVAAAMQWQNVGGGTPPGGYIDDAFRMNAVLDLDATGAAAAGTSIQRLDNTDDNDLADWSTGAGPASTFGLINVGQTTF
ncbi:MAG: Ig-like domain-containing protein [Kofleriaceae bacterium]